MQNVCYFQTKAMERDPKNYYQKSAGNLKRMINNFNKFKVNHNAFELANKECEEELAQRESGKLTSQKPADCKETKSEN